MKFKDALFYVYIAMVLVLTACGTTTLSVKSKPDKATIYAQRLGAHEKIELGQTPIDLSTEDFLKKVGGDSPFFLTLEKEGYATKTVVVTEIPNSDIELSHDLTVSTGFDDTVRTNYIINSIFEAQRLARARRYQDALTKLAEIKVKTPHVSVLYELEGSIFYIQKDFVRSLDAYSRAIQYDPQSAEAQQMLTVLDKHHGVRRVPDKIVDDIAPPNALPGAGGASQEESREPAEAAEGEG